MLNIKTFKPDIFPDLIERIWIAENTDGKIDLVIPPNQYVNLVFPYNNACYKRNNALINSTQLEGMSTENTKLTYPAGTKLVGIRFFAFGLYPFFQIDGKKLINNTIDELGGIEILENTIRFENNGLDTRIINKVYQLLNGLFCEKSYNKILSIKNFYNQFRWNDESNSIEAFCKTTGTNYTTLNRNFTQIVGITTKKFERLIKFRKALCNLIDSQDNLTAIGAKSGYFDQAHFIREFKIFLNQTPSDYKALIKLADSESKIINYNFKLF